MKAPMNSILVPLLSLMATLSVGASEDACPQRLVADDRAAWDGLGGSVSLSGSTAVLGAYGETGGRGAAYVFQLQPDGSWIQEAKLMDPEPNASDNFGWFVSVEGSNALIGAYLDDRGLLNSGSATVWSRQSQDSWVLEARLAPNDPVQNHYFGNSVSLSGDLAGVSAYGDDTGGQNAGSVYLFRRLVDGSWNQEAKLIGPDQTVGDAFGYSVSVSGNRVLVGSAFDDVNGVTNAGSAWIFEHDGQGNWDPVAQLLRDDAVAYDFFGISVSLQGDLALVGADNGAMERPGNASIFQRQSDGSWIEIQRLSASDAQNKDSFGIRVGLDGDHAIVGSYGDDDAGSASGSAYLFTQGDDGIWFEQAKLTASDAAAGDHFGCAVAASEGRGLVGASSDDQYAGSGHVFEFTGEDCNANGIIDQCEVGNDLNENGIPDDCECQGDLTGDLQIGIEDLLLIIDQWNSVGGPGDANLDGLVDVDDLLLVINAWGPCS
ncbi:MAG: hypothetical protein CMJ39_10160 [Phycisphaerae bacterium]|nr:hypothetical protein [Phycisphaerae bacterium]